MNQLDGVRGKIRRAKEHIENLKTELRAFRNRGAYVQVGHDEPETGDRVVRLRVGEEFPPQISLVLGDAIHNLRSSLDYLAYQLCIASRGTPDDNTGFPIWHRPPAVPDVKAEVTRKIPRANTKVIGCIKTLEPYKGGKGDIVWRLHRLDIMDKHKLLIGVATSAPNINLRGGIIPNDALFPKVPRPMKLPPRGLALEEGAELLRIKRADRTTMNVDPQFTFQVAFSEVCTGDPIIPKLEEFLKFINGIILPAFEPLFV